MLGRLVFGGLRCHAESYSSFFLDFPQHAELIGEMLLGYGELETSFLDLVAEVLDMDTAVRILYRLRGAQSRLDVGDAILRPVLTELKLKGQYMQWLGAIRHCKRIRNQFAHCAWLAEHGRLYLADFEESANSAEGVTGLQFHGVDLPLLEEQHSFFLYTLDVSLHLLAELRYRMDRRRRHKLLPVKSRAVPSLHNPPHLQIIP